MKYFIELQSIKDDQTPIKTITKTMVDNGNGQKQVFPVKFPCLKVIVKAESDDNSQFEITWSNFYFSESPEPGKFKIKRVSMRHEMFFERDLINGRKIMVGNRPVLDLMKMSKYGTEVLEDGTLKIGPLHPVVKTVLWEESMGGIETTLAKLTELFGDLSEEILSLFVTHELFLKYVTVPV